MNATSPIGLSEEEKMFQQEVANFAAKSIAPHVATMDESQKIVPSIISDCFELGLMGIEVSSDYGGAGGSFFLSCLAIEEIARVDPAVSVFVDVQNTLVNNALNKWGTTEQKQQYFPQLVSNKVGCFCLTEANSGSDAFALQSKALAKKNNWYLNGKKIFITNAAEASIFLVFANTAPQDGYKGITAFIIEKEQLGLSIGKKENKLGIRASSTCEVILEEVEVSSHNVLGAVGKGYKIAIETLNEGRIGIAAQMLGLAQGAYDAAFRYAHEREQFGKKIAHFQAIQFDLARMATQIQSARHMVYHAARLKDARQPFATAAAMAKYYVSEVAEKVASCALEIFGGYGFTKDFPVEKFYRDVKIGKIYEGTSNLLLATIYKMLATLPPSHT